MNLTLDTSVIAASLIPHTSEFVLARDLINKIYPAYTKVHLFEPSIFLFEFVNAVVRNETIKDPKTRDESLLMLNKICTALQTRPNVTFVAIDNKLWTSWKKKVLQNIDGIKLKTNDDIFLYVASINHAKVVTFDADMRKKAECAAGKVDVISPYECLKEIGNI